MRQGSSFRGKGWGNIICFPECSQTIHTFHNITFLHSLAVNFSIQSPWTLWTASNMVLMLSSNLRIHRYFCAMQSFHSSLNFPLFTLCSCYLPDTECPIRVVIITKGRHWDGRSIWQPQFYTFCEKKHHWWTNAYFKSSKWSTARYALTSFTKMLPFCILWIVWKVRTTDSEMKNIVIVKLKLQQSAFMCKSCILYPLQTCTKFASTWTEL